VEKQRTKIRDTISKEKLEKSRKFRLIEKEVAKRTLKYTEARLKATKARNEYLLCMDAANSSIHKYFMDDLSDLIDCMDFGFHQSLSRAMMMRSSALEQVHTSTSRGVTKRCRLSWLTNSALVYEPKCGGGELRGLSQ
jgi:SLIT-ROBO Rho GTPase activating protein